MSLGNGCLGAMVFGSVPAERLQLNEESLWAGEPFDVYPENFSKNLKTLQQLLLEGKNTEADAFGRANLTESPTSYRSYQPLADLWNAVDHASEITDYRRTLDLQTGIASDQYMAGNVLFKREILISAVDNVLAVKLSADRSGSLNVQIRLDREKDMTVKTIGDNQLYMVGQIVDIPAS
jgi:alpha-L-fucosidase 2